MQDPKTWRITEDQSILIPYKSRGNFIPEQIHPMTGTPAHILLIFMTSAQRRAKLKAELAAAENAMAINPLPRAAASSTIEDILRIEKEMQTVTPRWAAAARDLAKLPDEEIETSLRAHGLPANLNIICQLMSQGKFPTDYSILTLKVGDEVSYLPMNNSATGRFTITRAGQPEETDVYDVPAFSKIWMDLLATRPSD